MQSVIVLGDGRRVSIAAYCKALALAKANPDARFDRTFRSWAGGSGSCIAREFRDGIHDRINRKGGLA